MNKKAIGLTLAVSSIFAGGLFWARQQRAIARTRLYSDAISYIDTATKPGETIGYLSSHETYLFYGKNFDRQGVHIPFQRNQSVSAWLNSIRDRQIQALAVGRLINESGMDRAEIYQRLLQAEKSGKLRRVAGQDPRRESIVYRLEQP
ncbi:hypothetical protein [Leptolyngbya sp. NIES-2104]|uniref:hypothetical protein n=1 Tax=Leptolyngbya sp. NIES-2104 TaxID=1552121 RepID=UPI0006ECB806|nr:hypothetical protein [Leptolyngbya sp. NIES-2104]GAP97611.1 hypothetical protein NIES2104_41580 [Leptolyngbya sp. NIES-2104]